MGAELPVVLAGTGAHFSGAGEALSAVAERTGVPVTTTSAASGLLDDEHPRRLGGDVGLTREELASGWSRPAEALDEWARSAREGAAVSLRSWEGECERPAKRVHPGWLARETARFAEELGACTTVSDGGDSVLGGIAFFPAHRPGTHRYVGSAFGTPGSGVPVRGAARAARPDEPAGGVTAAGAVCL